MVEFLPQLTTRGPPTPPLPQLQLFTDASIEGWGAHLTSHQTSSTGSPRQRSLHINNLELLAIHLALQHFLPLVINKVMIVMTDNTTVVSQIKNQGGTHDLCTARLYSSSSGRTANTSPWSPRHIPGTSERGGRSIVPATSDHQLRVDTVSADTPPRVAPMGPASCRPLCHFRNRLPAHIHLSAPRPGSVEDRRLVLSVDGPVGLHVSSLPSHTGGASEDTGVQLPRHPSGPSVAISTLVSPSTVTARRPPEMPTSAADATVPTSVPDLSPGPVTPLSARLEAIKSALVSRGYSSTVATRIAASHRLSTQSVYDSKWRIFTKWCRDTGHDPFSTSTPVLADFLAFFFTAKGFAPTTIAGYRTTIINTLEKVHWPPSSRRASYLQPSQPVRDLALVLRALHYAPFEPLAKAPLWALTFKTVFPTALA